MFAVTLLLAAALTQQPPAPQPFPRAGVPQPPARPSEPAPTQQPQTPAAPAAPATAAPATAAPASSQAAADAGPAESQLGVQLYPGSQFLASYDAGRGQRYYLFGTTASFVDVVTFYRTALKQRGDLVFDAPATHQFDIGRFR